MGLYDREYGRYNDSVPQFGAGMTEKPAWMIILIVNVVMFVLNMLVTGDTDTFTQWLSVSDETLYRPYLWWQWLTYGFAHSPENIWNLLLNMFGLFMFGSAVERKLGRTEFARFFLIAIVVGGVVWSIRDALVGSGAGGVLGASGGVQAVVILFCFLFPHSTIYFMMVFPLKAWVAGILFVAYDSYGALFGTSPTAFDVHLAGIVFAATYHLQHWNLRALTPSSLTNWKPKFPRSRSNLKLHDPDSKLAKEAAEADRILTKISEQGEASLTSAERKKLERYSRRMREKRRSS